jgi:hypothetical protein
MITKVVLGVALVFIECSIVTLTQNNSLSTINETLSTSSTVPVSTSQTAATQEPQTSTTDFKLPENCSAYKVSFA